MINRPDYRKLGGWLMFIFVVNILGIVSYSSSLLNYVLMLPAGSVFDSIGIQYLFPSWYWVISITTCVIYLALRICILIFMQKRALKPFRIAFFTSYGVTILNYLLLALVYLFGGMDLEGFFRNYMSSFSSSYYNYDSTIDSALPYLQRLSDIMVATIYVTCAVCIAISIGLLIAWIFYFKKSKRVAVYFDPDYVEPPLVTPPPPGLYGGYPGQAYPPQGFGPQGYPVYPAYPPQQGYPAPGAYPPAGYPAPAPGPYPPQNAAPGVPPTGYPAAPQPGGGPVPPQQAHTAAYPWGQPPAAPPAPGNATPPDAGTPPTPPSGQ